MISIHSLRVEGDAIIAYLISNVKIFQSTPSVWRETGCDDDEEDADNGFQSTPSVWRETGRIAGFNVYE